MGISSSPTAHCSDEKLEAAICEALVVGGGATDPGMGLDRLLEVIVGGRARTGRLNASGGLLGADGTMKLDAVLVTPLKPGGIAPTSHCAGCTQTSMLSAFEASDSTDPITGG